MANYKAPALAADVITAVRNGESLRQIAARFGISHVTVIRYKKMGDAALAPLPKVRPPTQPSPRQIAAWAEKRAADVRLRDWHARLRRYVRWSSGHPDSRSGAAYWRVGTDGRICHDERGDAGGLGPLQQYCLTRHWPD